MEIDMKKTAIFLCILAFLLVSCAEKTVDLPMPADLFVAIEASVELSEMVDVSEDFLESNLGVLPADYRGAVYYIVSIGASCEEIIIIRAADEAKAEEIEEKLNELKNDPSTNGNDQDEIDALEKELEDIIKGIEDGSLVKPDYTDADNAIANAESGFDGGKLSDDDKAVIDELKK